MIRQHKLLGSTEVGFRGISIREHHEENFSLTCKCPWYSSQATGQTRYSQGIAVLYVFRSGRLLKWWQKRRPRETGWLKLSKDSPRRWKFVDSSKDNKIQLIRGDSDPKTSSRNTS